MVEAVTCGRCVLPAGGWSSACRLSGVCLILTRCKRPLAHMRAKFQIETEKVQELVGALRFLPRDFCTGFRAEFQGFARLLSASKWRGNTCTFRARLTMLTCDRQWCFAPITTHKSMPGTSHLGNDTDGCRGSDTANEVLSQRQFCRAYFQASSDLHRPSPIDPA